MKYEVRALTMLDFNQVEQIDLRSGNCVADWLDQESGAWGVFEKGTLVGYCTLGFAEGTYDDIDEHPLYTTESLLLSDVYVLPEHRGKKCASYLISTVLQSEQVSGEAVFLTLLDDDLVGFYEVFGFNLEEDGLMVKGS